MLTEFEDLNRLDCTAKRARISGLYYADTASDTSNLGPGQTRAQNAHFDAHQYILLQQHVASHA